MGSGLLLVCMFCWVGCGRIQGCAGAPTPAALDRVRYRTFWLPLGARLVSVQQVMLP